jgi:4-diphosphocytidyl-2-C-methyl-D-erythritol kinase
MTAGPSFHLLAHAKINLFLHVTGKRDDGYHLLQSLVAFADIGDTLEFSPHDGLALTITGPFGKELDANDNTIIKAASLLAAHHQIKAKAKIRLTKSLPVAAGIGGGSADAAAAINGLERLWGVSTHQEDKLRIAAQIGADIPACLDGQALWMEGIGEKITPVPSFTPLHAVLVNPDVPVLTADVFKHLAPPFNAPMFVRTDLPFLKECRNDLTSSAIQCASIINEVLSALTATEGCEIARMSGSGATCFGIYPSTKAAEGAAQKTQSQHPYWWVQRTVLK